MKEPGNSQQPKKIIHLSDLHCGYRNMSVIMGDIMTRLIYHKSPGSDYVVVITGDLVNDARQKNCYREVSIHLDRLSAAGFHVLVIPGNHDYGTGMRGYPGFVGRFKEHFFGDPAVSYPKLDLIGPVAFIGLDSMAAEMNWHDRFFSDGELGKEQLQRLRKILESDTVKQCRYTVVYLHHHPLAPQTLHELKDSEDLRKVLADYKIDALLFGHNHHGLVWNGGWGIARVYDAGSTTGKRRMVPGPHRIIDLCREPFFDYDAKLI